MEYFVKILYIKIERKILGYQGLLLFFISPLNVTVTCIIDLIIFLLTIFLLNSN